VPTSTYCRLAGGLGLLAGVTRLLLALAPGGGLARPWAETLYMSVDLGLLFGLTGFYLRHAGRRSAIGALGLLIAVAGVLAIRTGERSVLGPAAYGAGSSMMVVGCALLSAPQLSSRTLAAAAAGLWWAVLVVVSAGGVLGHRSEFQSAAAGLFGLGMVVGGLATWRSPPAGAAI